MTKATVGKTFPPWLYIAWFDLLTLGKAFKESDIALDKVLDLSTRLCHIAWWLYDHLRSRPVKYIQVKS
jgi:hypothetical protein